MTAERRAQCDVDIEPCDELELLNALPPEREDSAGVWVAWHRRHVVCWQRIAAKHPFLAENAELLIECHERSIVCLFSNPDSRRARRGYWDLEPKLIDWPT